MVKRIFSLLIIAYGCYSFLVYSYGTKKTEQPSQDAMKGFSIWQTKNCQACHQLYGLGGYMGPDLTNVISDTSKNLLLLRAMIQGGSPRMPNFNFTDAEIDNLIAFLTWVDKSGRSFVPKDKVTKLGNYNIDKK